jgi:hypothetical protein
MIETANTQMTKTCAMRELDLETVPEQNVENK